MTSPVVCESPGEGVCLPPIPGRFTPRTAASSDDVQILERHSSLAWCESARIGGKHTPSTGAFAIPRGRSCVISTPTTFCFGRPALRCGVFQPAPRCGRRLRHRVLIDEDGLEVGRLVLPVHDDAVLSWADTYLRKLSSGGVACGTVSVPHLTRVSSSRLTGLDPPLSRRRRPVRPAAPLPGRFSAAPRTKDGFPDRPPGASRNERLRERCHGRRVSYAEVSYHIARYLFRHVLCHRLYLLGLARY